MSKKILIIKYNQSIDIIDGAVDILQCLSTPYPIDLATIYLENYKNCIDEFYKAINGYDGIILGDISRAPQAIIAQAKKKLDLYADIICYHHQADGDVDLVYDSAWVNTGDKGIKHGDLGRSAYDTDCYSAIEIERVLRIALDIADSKNKRIILADDAKAREIGILCRSVLGELVHDYQSDMECVDVSECITKLLEEPLNSHTIVTTRNNASSIDSVIRYRLKDEAIFSAIAVTRSNLTMCEPLPIDSDPTHSLLGLLHGIAIMLRRSLDMVDCAKALEKSIDIAIRNNDLDYYQTIDAIKQCI